jgi:hypothetical protein
MLDVATDFGHIKLAVMVRLTICSCSWTQDHTSGVYMNNTAKAPMAPALLPQRNTCSTADQIPPKMSCQLYIRNHSLVSPTPFVLWKGAHLCWRCNQGGCARSRDQQPCCQGAFAAEDLNNDSRKQHPR